MIEDTAPVEILVLGPLLVRVGGMEKPISAPKQRQLIARLAIANGQVVSAHQLIDALWGDRPPPTATKNLQVLVGRLRGVIGTETIETDPGGYTLRSGTCAIDAWSFVHRLASVERCISDGRIDNAIAELEQARAAWRGEVACECQEPWGMATVARWNSHRLLAHERLLTLRAATRPTPDLISEVRTLIESHPHRESLRVLLVDALWRSGDVHAARRELDQAVAVLDRDLGLEPGGALAIRAAEFGASEDGQSVMHPPADPTLAETLDDLGDRFAVTEALAKARGSGLDHLALLDELEAMVVRGELDRHVDHDGQVTLVRVRPGAGDSERCDM